MDKLTILKEIHAQVPGMVQLEECSYLWDLALQCGRGVIVEIGSAQGLSTICLAKGSKMGRGVKIYAVDPFNGGGATPDPTWYDMDHPGTPNPVFYVNQGVSFAPFWQNILKFNVYDIVVPIVNYSELAVKQYPSDPIELLFIDGDHRFNYVKLDLELWTPFMLEGALLLMHDSTYHGVRRAIQEVLPKLGFSNICESPIFTARKGSG